MKSPWDGSYVRNTHFGATCPWGPLNWKARNRPNESKDPCVPHMQCCRASFHFLFLPFIKKRECKITFSVQFIKVGLVHITAFLSPMILIISLYFSLDRFVGSFPVLLWIFFVNIIVAIVIIWGKARGLLFTPGDQATALGSKAHNRQPRGSNRFGYLPITL